MPRRVLLTGGAGFIGSHLARTLLDDGWSVDIVDDLSTGSTVNLPDGASFHQLDVTDRSSLDELPDVRYDAIAHLAGQSSGEKSFDDPPYDLDANARSTVVLASWALERGIPALLQASSMGVYGQPPDLPISEDAPRAPLSWYGASKSAAEHALAVATTQGLRGVSLRMFSVYGPGQDLSEMRQGMVSIFLAFVLAGDPVVVRGSLERVRDFLYVGDCVEAWRVALERDVRGVINLGTGTGTTVGELIAMLLAAAGKDPGYPVASDGSVTAGDQFAVIADASRAAELLSWKARVMLPEGLAKMVSWATSGD